MPQIFAPEHHPDWLRLHDDLALHQPDATTTTQKLPADSGVYLWTVRFDAVEYTLYVGKAKTLNKRIYNYSQPFQPHSPNDRKLYFAQEALRNTKPEARFPLYWKPVSLSDLNEAEYTAIILLKPVLNDRNRYSAEHRARLAESYGALYSEVIAMHFSEA